MAFMRPLIPSACRLAIALPVAAQPAMPAQTPLSNRELQGAFRGSVPAGDNTGTVLPLRLDNALQLALRNNLGAASEANAVRPAQGQRQVARSGLLPQANPVVTETVEQINLRTLGVTVSAFPSAVGPFNLFDARAARVNQAVVDVVRWRNLHAAVGKREGTNPDRQKWRFRRPRWSGPS
jgi:outer membrane protein TolC